MYALHATLTLTGCFGRPYDLAGSFRGKRLKKSHPGGNRAGDDVRTGVQGLAENRKFERALSRLRCWCEGENVTVYARIGNLSEGGLFLRTSTPLERGSRTVVRFGDENIEATAQVVWARSSEGAEGPPGMGLMFVDIDDIRLQQIRQLVQGELTQSAAKKNGS
jgi:uncharacterized protein (TIGR02266 family)